MTPPLGLGIHCGLRPQLSRLGPDARVFLTHTPSMLGLGRGFRRTFALSKYCTLTLRLGLGLGSGIRLGVHHLGRLPPFLDPRSSTLD